MKNITATRGLRGRSARFAVLSLALALPTIATQAQDEPATATDAGGAGDDSAALPTIPVADAPAPDAPELKRGSSSRLIEEIVVTAQKREEKLQDVPISISAFSADTLDARGLVNIQDLALATPGLQFTDLASYSIIFLRGVGTDAFIPSADPSIATYVDGVYFPSAHSLAQSFGALQRIEVLKGPQGTLFGRNSTGGAINVVTKDPDQSQATEIQTSYGRFDDFKFRGYTNIPLNDTLATSLSVVYNNSDPYYVRDNADGRPLMQDITRGGRIKLRWTPLDSLDFTLTGIRTRQVSSVAASSITTHPSPLAIVALVPAEQRDYVVTDDSFPMITIDTTAIYGQGIWKSDPFDIKLIGSDYKVDSHDFQYDFDGSARPLINFVAQPEYQTIKTAELQLTSNDTSWLADRFKWVGGFYYLHSVGGYDPAYLQVASRLLTLPTGQIVNLIPRGALDALSLAGLPAPQGVRLYFRGLLGTDSYSGFVQGTYNFTDWLNLTLGGRYQVEKRALLVSNVEVDNLGGSTTPLIQYAPRSSKENNLSPKITLDIKPFEDVLAYASYSKGFKSATYNIVNIYQQPDFVKPEIVSSYELGIKSEFFNHLVRFNAAVFQTDIKDLQTAFVSLTSGGAVRFQNAGAARIRGVEFDMLLVPLPDLDPGLVFTPGLSLLKAIYTDYTNGTGFNETTGLAFANGNFNGNRIARTPKSTATIGVSQTIDVTDGTIEIGGDYYYNSGFYFLAQNSPVSFEPHYSVVNARVSYLYKPWDVRLTAFGSNLTNERYDTQQFHTDFGRADTLAPPIEYGVRVNWTF
ncbi:MAG: hypothetical protein JWQ90_837 [Hydrocarboniphaga sp.]|uniref:TonB-dependent receptor n=1 Tax=Hydrocarboniphaga sp. TaxID=2033016 RepID=UPI00262BB115|nr:TonB-dependent receptor [Hydrocarboniphaga sp.]MDB5968387.1 hypothetical protein [Hydrocarboniphaga sp.]